MKERVQREAIYVLFIALDQDTGIYYLTEEPKKAHNFGVIEIRGDELIEYNKACGSYARWQERLRATAGVISNSPRESDTDSDR